MQDPKPHTAASQSLKYLDAIATESTTPKMRRANRNHRGNASTTQTVESQPSEFNLQLLKIRENEQNVKKAIETSDMLLKMRGISTGQGLSSTQRIGDDKSSHFYPNQTSGPTLQSSGDAHF